jgi:1-pyrroline-5-carboxylate dehydrogenase
MTNAFFSPPPAVNEPVLSYAPGSVERAALLLALKEAKAKVLDIPMYIGGQEIRTGVKNALQPPHEHQHVLGHYHVGTSEHVKLAINAALAAKNKWSEMAFEARAAIFLKAASLIAGPYRFKLMAATMLGQSKNTIQTELDAACEMIDFLRFNVQYMTEIYRQQPSSTKDVWNRTEHRALEGFVFALSPFNFTAIAGNLPTSAAMMGNTVVWKPSNTQIYSANVLMEVFIAAGLPAGVINLIYVSGPDAGNVIFKHPDFAGIHFTGSTAVFQNIWKEIGNNIHTYKNYPRIVGETGGKDFILAHASAEVPVLVTALSRGAFEFQGQKCSAASRAYIPQSLWPAVKAGLMRDLASFKMGPTEDLSNFINAVIDETAFDKIVTYIENARNAPEVEIIAGGKYDKTVGYFIEPTILLTRNPKYVSMCEEIFGPVLTIFVYEDVNFEATIELVDNTAAYALTGAIIAQDREAIELVTGKLRYAAGNFYINDKCTGAVVGQQPFGGARKSGTNDKAGSMLNLLRWTSPRTIKEVFVPPTDYRYPFME